jgi:predicted ATPase
VVICGANGTVARVDGERRILDALTSLIDKQLLRHAVEPDGTSRYRMLETIRAFARERLVASGEMELIQRRHATYYLRFAEAALEGQEPLANRSANGLDKNMDNFRAALQWSTDRGDTALGLRLAEIRDAGRRSASTRRGGTG